MHTPAAAQYLEQCEIIDHGHNEIIRCAQELRVSAPLLTAINCFRFVRDQIHHCRDIHTDKMPLSASQTLAELTGFCYAKSHLLTALLRQNGIPCGLGYMRLVDPKTESGYSLHCFNNIYLEPYGWSRADTRGSKNGIKPDFDPPGETLTHYPDLYQGEYFLQGNFHRPLPCVLDAYGKAKNINVLRHQLPDDH